MGKTIFLIALMAGIVAVSVMGAGQGFAPLVQNVSPPLNSANDVPAFDKATDPIYAAGVVEGTTPDVELHCEVSGRIVEIAVAEGDNVEKDTILLRLDDRQQQAAVSLAEADLQIAVAERVEAENILKAKTSELQRAELEWSRTEQLLKEKATSQRVADNQRITVDALRSEVAAASARVEPTAAGISLAQARIDAAKSRLELAKILLEKTTLRAPSRGKILAINAEVGELTNLSEASPPLVVMCDDSQLHVRAFVEEFDAGRIAIGAKAFLLSNVFGAEKLAGDVIWISPRMTPKQLWRNKAEELFDVKTREVLIRCEASPLLVIGSDLDVTIDSLPR